MVLKSNRPSRRDARQLSILKDQLPVEPDGQAISPQDDRENTPRLSSRPTRGADCHENSMRWAACRKDHVHMQSLFLS